MRKKTKVVVQMYLITSWIAPTGRWVESNKAAERREGTNEVDSIKCPNMMRQEGKKERQYEAVAMVLRETCPGRRKGRAGG